MKAQDWITLQKQLKNHIPKHHICHWENIGESECNLKIEVKLIGVFYSFEATGTATQVATKLIQDYKNTAYFLGLNKTQKSINVTL